MKKISLDNGVTFMDATEAMREINENNLWDVVVNLMDDDTRERVAYEFGPDTNAEFLAKYLEIAEEDLIIG